MTERLIRRVLKGPYSKVTGRIRGILQIGKEPNHPDDLRRRHPRPKKYVKAIRNGNYYRIKIPSKPNQVAEVIRLPPSSTTTKQPKSQNVQKVIIPPNATFHPSYGRRLFQWFKSNLPVISLNIGSICILVGFSRSDVLELRSLTMTGQLTFAAYTLSQSIILWPSVLWSSLFASVNAYKILSIFHERNAQVHLTQQQELVFVEHFMPHGVTPKQFERIYQKSKIYELKKGNFLIRKGDVVDQLYLVVKGSTHAHILGRHLAAASTSSLTKGDQLEGGDSGAWVGEMAFLDWLWDQSGPGGSGTGHKGRVYSGKEGRGVAMYTIMADEDCTVMAWSHKDMADLMDSTVDLRSALTRAMTSAVVGKAVNLTIGRSIDTRSSWSTWLSDLKNNNGARIRVREE